MFVAVLAATSRWSSSECVSAIDKSGRVARRGDYVPGHRVHDLCKVLSRSELDEPDRYPQVSCTYRDGTVSLDSSSDLHGFDCRGGGDGNCCRAGWLGAGRDLDCERVRVQGKAGREAPAGNVRRKISCSPHAYGN